MRTQVKFGLYAVTLIGTLLFGSLFMRAWRQADAAASSPAGATKVSKAAKAAKPPAARPGGSQKPGGTNAVVAGTNTPAATNAVAAAEADAGETPAAEAGAGEPTPEREPVDTTNALAVRGRGVGKLIVWGLLAVASVLGLGGLLAYDVSQFAGSRAAEALFDHDGEALPESAYEEVEKVYGEGDFLEAVRLLRAFLEENPKALHAKIRIAEIYEKDLNNPVAATLEYEEVLKFKFEPERRGWAAIHLVNLYNRLDKPDQATAWLKRVVAECPGTPAAGKARERLAATGQDEPEDPPESGGDGSSGLPRGFKPRS